MAGHRRGTGKLTRPVRRIARFTAMLAEATTAEEQLAAAIDWFRAAASGNPEAMRDMAAELANAAQRLDRRAA